MRRENKQESPRVQRPRMNFLSGAMKNIDRFGFMVPGATAQVQTPSVGDLINSAERSPISPLPKNIVRVLE